MIYVELFSGINCLTFSIFWIDDVSLIIHVFPEGFYNVFRGCFVKGEGGTHCWYVLIRWV